MCSRRHAFVSCKGLFVQFASTNQKLLVFLSRCPDEKFGDAPWEVYKCTDGTNIDFEAVKSSKLTGKCACGQGGKPVCASTNEPPKCPAGEEPSSKIGYIASFIKNCQ